MSFRYQFKHADSMDDWNHGQEDFDTFWDHAKDQLRFHRGDGFTIREKPDDPGPKRTLREVKSILESRLDRSHEDTVFVVRSKKDQWGLAARRHKFEDPIAVQMEQWARAQLGDRYILGAAGPDAWDCSGYTMVNTKVHTGISLVHKATWQMRDPRVHSITRAHIKPMDMLFLHGNFAAVDHVAYFLDWKGPGGSGRVIDAEPHDTTAPSGWPTPNLGTGIRVRPMLGNYYCSWQFVVKIGRLYAVNGRP